MAEHRARIFVAAPAERIFAFVANPTSLPRWQPSFREAFREGPDRIRAIGGGVGAAGVAAHVRFEVDGAGRQVSWAAASGAGCAGDVVVRPAEAGAEVELVLRLAQRAERPEALATWTGDPAMHLAAALRASLEAIRLICEDRTESVPLVSGGTDAHPEQAALRDSRAYGSSATQNPDITR
jgi:hypothetical protein